MFGQRDKLGKVISISESGIYSYFGSTYAARGNSYQRSGRVLSVHLNHDDKVLSGRVKGRSNRAYKVEIKLSDRPDNSSYGIVGHNCSCPMGGFCKHSAALLFDIIRTKKLDDSQVLNASLIVSDKNILALNERTETSTSQLQLSSELTHWLSSLNSSLLSKSASTQDNSVIDTVLYVLDTTYDQLHLTLKVGHARKRKYGDWGQIQRTDLDRLANRAAKYVSEEDYEIAKLFLDSRAESGWRERSSFPDTPEISQIIMKRLISTNRCYWQEITDAPLTLGNAKAGTLQWEAKADGKQILRLHASTNEITVIGGIPWYVNPQEHILGPLVFPISMKALKVIITAPPIEPTEAIAASEALKQFGSVIPVPRTDYTIETITLSPIPCLTLSTIDTKQYEFGSTGYSYDEAMPIASVSFEYPSVKFKSANELEYRSVEGNKIVIRKRDLTLEKKFVRQIEQFGLKQIHHRQSQINTNLFSFSKDNETDWLHFSREAIPQLKQQDWQVKFDRSFKFQVVVPEEEWLADATEGSDFWFSLNLDIAIEGKKAPLLPIIHEALRRIYGKEPLAEIEKLSNNGIFYAPLADGRHVALPFERVKVIVETLLELFDKSNVLPKKTITVSLSQMIGLVNAIGQPEWIISDKLKNLVDKIKNFRGLAQVVPPPNFGAQLRPYQLEGLSWLNFLQELGLGGILADDMGLGKTVQTLAHIVTEQNKDKSRLKKPFLVICPTSVLPNWMSEIEKFTPTLKALSLWGPNRAQNFFKIRRSDIVVTTYPLVVRDADTLLNHSWKALILDEAQMIKNPDTLVTQTVGKFRCNYRVCLTGTPVENHLGELWSQYNFLMPGFLGNQATFNKVFRTQIEKQKNLTVQKILSERVRPFLLRRTKELVAKELPEKTTIVRQVELEGAQRDLYETVRLAMYEKVKEALAGKGLSKSQIIILDALLKLRQVCCDPRLVSIPAAKKVMSSAKLVSLISMLEELLAESKKILLFSQFTSMLDLIIPELEKRKIDFVQIRGDTIDRATPVHRFQNGEVPLFLLSLKAGGFGLNLTTADTVIHYDPWWNPAVENQATDRAHRIGQKQAVFVFKLIASGTIEERMLVLQERKRAIAAGIYNDDNNLPFKLTAEDLESLFSPLTA